MAITFTTTRSTPVSGTSNGFYVTLPARKAGDYLQIIVVSSANATMPAVTPAYVKKIDVAGVIEVYEKPVTTDGTAGATVQIDLSANTAYTAFAQVLHAEGSDGTGNPPEPSAPDVARLLGITAGQFSGLPFNSGVNPAGRGGRFGAPDGYEYLNDDVEGERGNIPFDTRHGFQYNNRSLSEGATAWNDLIGMQNLDWFDPTKPAVLAIVPFPSGGSWAQAATGAYDAKWTAIGQTIAQKRPAGSTAKVVLRLAWEFNGTWYTEHRGVDANGNVNPSFVAGWRKIVTALRAGAGDRVTVNWNVSAEPTSTKLAAMYPGDDYVDIVGIDIYDANGNSPGGFHSITPFLDQTGVGWIVQFARDHSRLVAFDEWGGHATGGYNDGGDNPDFPRIMSAYFKSIRSILAYEAQFNDVAPGNVENNLWNTNGQPIQLPNQRAAYISAYAAL